MAKVTFCSTGHPHEIEINHYYSGGELMREETFGPNKGKLKPIPPVSDTFNCWFLFYDVFSIVKKGVSKNG